MPNKKKTASGKPRPQQQRFEKLRELASCVKALACTRCYVAVLDAGAKKASGGIGHP
jgi:hypothetical protein